MRASEPFAETATWVNEVFRVRREGIAFRSGKLVEWPRRQSADTVEMRFHASKGDKLREGTAITRSGCPASKDHGKQQQPGVVKLLIRVNVLRPNHTSTCSVSCVSLYLRHCTPVNSKARYHLYVIGPKTTWPENKIEWLAITMHSRYRRGQIREEAKVGVLLRHEHRAAQSDVHLHYLKQT